MGNEKLFRDEPVWKAICKLAVPAVFTILIMVLYNMADMFFIGMLGNDTAVASISVVGPVFSLATAVSTTLGAGGCAVLANALGAGDQKKAQAAGSMCVWASLLFGAVFAVVSISAAVPLLRLLGATEDMMPDASAYLRTLAAGAPLMLFSQSIASTIRGEGIIIRPMVNNIAGTVTNLILDPLFILVMRTGVTGAALATVLGNLAACALHVRTIRTKAKAIRFDFRPALRQMRLLPQILFLGLPNGLSSILAGLTSTFSNQLLGAYGTGAIAAMAAAGRSSMVISMVQMGVCLGVAPMLAYNYGARNIHRLKEVLVKTGILTVSFGLIATVGCFAGRDFLVGLFLKDAENTRMAKSFLVWLLLASPLYGLHSLSSNFLQAAGNAFLATVISVLRQGALLIPALFLFHAVVGLAGIGIAHFASDILAVAIGVVILLRQVRRLEKRENG